LRGDLAQQLEGQRQEGRLDIQNEINRRTVLGEAGDFERQDIQLEATDTRALDKIEEQLFQDLKGLEFAQNSPNAESRNAKLEGFKLELDKLQEGLIDGTARPETINVQRRRILTKLQRMKSQMTPKPTTQEQIDQTTPFLRNPETEEIEVDEFGKGIRIGVDGEIIIDARTKRQWEENDKRLVAEVAAQKAEDVAEAKRQENGKKIRDNRDAAYLKDMDDDGPRIASKRANAIANQRLIREGFVPEFFDYEAEPIFNIQERTFEQEAEEASRIANLPAPAQRRAAPRPTPAPEELPTVTTQKQLDNLPSGARFKDSDGNIRQKN
jgi:hypothetical protein